ncbi:MAG: hypothetical protein J5953_08710 [Prevotella sp.]|nr:hypothetical protein [Prevotella sp.]
MKFIVDVVAVNLYYVVITEVTMLCLPDALRLLQAPVVGIASQGKPLSHLCGLLWRRVQSERL